MLVALIMIISCGMVTTVTTPHRELSKAQQPEHCNNESDAGKQDSPHTGLLLSFPSVPQMARPYALALEMYYRRANAGTAWTV